MIRARANSKFSAAHKGNTNMSIGFPDICKTIIPSGGFVPVAYPNEKEQATETAKKETTTRKGMDQPPCKILAVEFKKLRILEANVMGMYDVKNPGIWEQSFSVDQVNAKPDHIVQINFTDRMVKEASQSRAHLVMPLEVEIAYTEYVRVITYDKGQTYLHSFSIATGGWVNRDRAYASPIPYSEQIQGNNGDWELGEQILSASENGVTYDVEYSVRCAPVIESEIAQSKLIMAILGPIKVEDELIRRNGILHLKNSIQKYGFAIRDEYPVSEDTLLTLEGPYTAEQFVESLENGDIQNHV